jgi:DNA-binding response OmpR family regulator
MKRILITEDDQFIANICRGKFEEEGFEVCLARDGREAIELLDKYPPALVLLDLMLPEIDGIGVLKHIRSSDSLRRLPVIVLSNSSYFSGPAQAAWKAGATNFLNKGDHGPQSLVDEVRKLLVPAKPPPLPNEPPPLPPRAFLKRAPGRIRVIVADDDRVIQGALGFIMEQAGFVVRSAFDGRRALEMAEADPPDIMVLDGLMPELDGFAVLNLWQKHPRLVTVPVIMLTTERSEVRKSAALDSGAVEYLTKPFSPAGLVEIIQEYVGSRV